MSTYQAYVTTRGTHERFKTLEEAANYLRGEIYTPETLEEIKEEIDSRDKYQTVYGFHYGEIVPL